MNTVNPTFVATDMVQNDAFYRKFLPDEEIPTREQFMDLLRGLNKLPIPWMEPIDISNAILWLAQRRVPLRHGSYPDGGRRRIELAIAARRRRPPPPFRG